MRSFFTVIFLFCSIFAQAQAHSDEPVLSSFELHNPDLVTKQLVNQFFALESRRGTTYEVIVPADQVGLFLSLAPQAQLKDPDTAATAKQLLQEYRQQNFATREGYHSLEQVQAWMRQVASEYPEFVQLVEYGKSGANRPLMALRLNSSKEPRPVLMITAATHGDELITTEVLKRLIDKLIVGYGNDSRFTQMIDRHDLYFVPVLNVDGYAATSRFDGRADPNRSYPYPGVENAKPTPSIAGIISLYEKIKPVASIDFHAFGEMIMYPWAYTHDPIDAVSRERLHGITGSMAATNNYVFGPISDVIYVAKGSSADYYFWKSQVMSIAIEIGSSKIPNPSMFPAYVQSQEESMWKFIESF